MEKTWGYFPNDALPYHYKYEHSAVTTDCVIFSFDGHKLNVLLIQRGLEPYKGQWAFPGGFLKTDETVEQGALRELREETGLEPTRIEQFGCFSAPDRDPRERVLTIAFFALVRPREVKGGDDAADAKWFSLDELPLLAFDHAEILKSALSRLKQAIHFEPIGFELMNEEFKISDLQRLYEAILDTKFDRRNFQKKILSLGILEEASEEDRGSLRNSESSPSKYYSRNFDYMSADSMPEIHACSAPSYDSESDLLMSEICAAEAPSSAYKKPRSVNANSLKTSSDSKSRTGSSTDSDSEESWSRAPKRYRFIRKAYDAMKKNFDKKEF